MNRLTKWMMRLYPARWRRRYGDELDALLCETGADARVVADLLKGGVRMQFSTWSFAKLAVVLGITGVLLGAAGSFLITPIYESRATFEMTGPQPNSVFLQIEPTALSRSSLAGVIKAPQLQLYVHELKVTPFEDVIERMKDDIHFDLIDWPGAKETREAFQISFQYPDPAKARMVISTLIQKLVDESFQQRLDHVAGRHYLYVIDPASLPLRPFFPSLQLVGLVACLLGASIPFTWRRPRKKRIATWGFAIWVAVFGFAGMLAADVFYWYDNWEIGPHLLGEQYRSTATMFVQNGTAEQIQAIATDATRNGTLTTIINDPRLDLYKRERQTQPLEDVIQNMRRNLAIRPSGQYLNVSFEYHDRYKAQQAVSALTNRLYEAYRLTYGGLSDKPVQAAPSTLKLIDEPSMPVLPVSPNRYVIAMKAGSADCWLLLSLQLSDDAMRRRRIFRWMR